MSRSVAAVTTNNDCDSLTSGVSGKSYSVDLSSPHLIIHFASDTRPGQIIIITMKLIAALTGASYVHLVQAAISQASVYTFDAEPQSAIAGLTSPSTTPETARLVLARRLGLSQYHNLHTADDTTIDYLNRFGGRQNRLLPSYEDEVPLGKLLIIVEGVDEPTGPVTSLEYGSCHKLTV